MTDKYLMTYLYSYKRKGEFTMARNIRVATFTINQLAECDYEKGVSTYDSVIKCLGKLIERVLPDKPDLLVLPEHCGRQNTLPERMREYYEGGYLKIFEYLKSVANNNHCYIAYSHLKYMEDGTKRNCVSMIDRNGLVMGEYHKNYPTPDETDIGGVIPGGDVSVFNCDFGTVCPIVCFDLNFDGIRKEIKEKKPDIITFHSAFHGSFMQEYFAYDTRSYFVSSLLSHNPSRILSPLGKVVATTTNYHNFVTATINLDYAVCHLDFNWDKIRKAKEKYGPLLIVEDPGYIGSVLLSYEGTDKTINDIIEEYDLEILDNYMARSIKNREENKEKK